LLAFLVKLDQVNYPDGIESLGPTRVSASATPTISLVLLDIDDIQFKETKNKNVMGFRIKYQVLHNKDKGTGYFSNQS
jgi:hypothetical protein